ncbi:Hypothetical predicted protein [Octopus vulgaris]|uniref:Uncharacterized protein n=1 Tax=Octopus vulgaris TaxID=6645 RepID=A0AA36AII6_OCTVU|nr:Hypothetical predicted protein [Octopus vulgaris]
MDFQTVTRKCRQKMASPSKIQEATPKMKMVKTTEKPIGSPKKETMGLSTIKLFKKEDLTIVVYKTQNKYLDEVNPSRINLGIKDIPVFLIVELYKLCYLKR